ncbi:MAG TPA: alternative cytochrome c oxidase polypeptide CoxN [Pelagibacterales bacterium]|nr:alternative cytochrome c oxidase polypeptide CoxN [Pelagibacterales bacterium]
MRKKESIFQILAQKPWDPSQAKIDDMHEGGTINLSKGKLGLRFIMFVSTIFFCLFIVTYSDRMVYPDWQRMPEPWLLWINTAVLFFSSMVFVSTQIASKNNQFQLVKNRLLLIGFLAFAFLVGQLLVWQQLIANGFYVSTNPSNAYFYVFTALHGLHLLGGLVYWYLTIKKVWISSNIVISKAKHTVDLCAIYWHFLLAVWVVLFGLMLFS